MRRELMDAVLAAVLIGDSDESPRREKTPDEHQALVDKTRTTNNAKTKRIKVLYPLAEAGDKSAQQEILDWMHSCICGMPYRSELIAPLMPVMIGHVERSLVIYEDKIREQREKAKEGERPAEGC